MEVPVRPAVASDFVQNVQNDLDSLAQGGGNAHTKWDFQTLVALAEDANSTVDLWCRNNTHLEGVLPDLLVRIPSATAGAQQAG
jgi:hypothetical protein